MIEVDAMETLSKWNSNMIKVIRRKLPGVPSWVITVLRRSNKVDGEPLETLPLDDADVVQERCLVSQLDPEQMSQNFSLVVRDLTKKYANFVAVNQISFTVRRGECFGLLGVNGAGKTTTFKMITGDTPLTFGDIYVNGASVKSQPRKAQQEIGYCGQFDALLDDLTGEETLAFYARCRGIRERKIRGEIEEMGRLLYFSEHLKKLVGDYSGGNKRKLSTAIVSAFKFL